MSEQTLITWHEHTVKRKRGAVIWFTGLSGSGKSTVSNCVDEFLNRRGIASFVLDGDNVRHGLNASPKILEPIHGSDFAKRFGLGFSAQDREENIRRIGAVAELFCSAGLIVLTAFVSPYRKDRELARRQVIGGGTSADFIEVFVDTPLEICEKRDPKGLYKKARTGELKGMTGIDDPYEPPLSPEVTLKTNELTVEQCAEKVIAYLSQTGKI